MIKVLYFGRLSDVAGRREETLELPKNITSLSDLKTWLSTEHELGDALNDTSVKTMVNQQLILTNLTLNGDEEIGFLPPVGGG
jgi:molybdopterin converting factor subunit 1